MITKIRIQNFMSHEDTVIEPASGVTLICGPNNCGKSAIALALGCVSAITEGRGKYMIRHKEKQATVTVDLQNEDGPHQIQWRRKKATAGWTIDGTASDRGAPPELHHVLRLPPYVDNEIHFGEQKSPLFILDGPGSKKAEFFASASDAAYVLEMQNLHKANHREADKNKRVITERIGLKENQLEALSPIDGLNEQIQSAEKEHGEIRGQQNEIGNLQQRLNDFGELSTQIQTMEKRNNCLSNLPVPPEPADTEPLSIWIREKGVACAAQKSATLQAACLKPLQDPPDLLDTTLLATLIRNVQSAGHRLFGADRAKNVLDRLPDTPQLTSVQATRELLNKLEKARLKVEESSLYLEKVNQKIEACREEIEKWAGTGKQCQTCGAEFNAKTLTLHLSEHE